MWLQIVLVCAGPHPTLVRRPDQGTDVPDRRRQSGAGNRMALKLNGKDDGFTGLDFLTLARTIDLPAARAEAAISEIAVRLSETAPHGVSRAIGGRTAKAAQDSIRRLIAERVATFR